MVKKQNWYKCWWVNRGGRYHHTSRNHNGYRYVQEKMLAPTRAEWFEGFVERGIDIKSAEVEDLTWYDLAILRWFAEFGESKYHLLDIWDETDWEGLRQHAISKGIVGVPNVPIRGPSRIVRYYHRLFRPLAKPPSTVLWGGLRYIMRHLLP